MMRDECFYNMMKRAALIVPIYGFMFFFGPVAWQLWMALRLGFVSLEEARRCLLSPYTVCIAGILFLVNTANLVWGMERISAGKDGAFFGRMAVHYVSLLLFATIGTAASMSMLSGASGGRVFPPLKMIVGALNGASMCFAFYTGATMAVAARLVPLQRRQNKDERGILTLTRSLNVSLFAIGVPLFIVTNLAAAALGGRMLTSASMYQLFASMAMPLVMGSMLFIRADKRVAGLLGSLRKELTQ